MLERAPIGGGWFTVAATAEDIDAVAARLGLETSAPGRGRDRTARSLRWRMAGLDDPRREPWMPFFLAWDIPVELHPGRARAGHGIRAEGIAWVEAGGDAERLREWLGGEELPIRVIEGEPGLRRVGVATSDREIVIE